MEASMRLLHKVAGVITVLIFLGTGAYMRLKSPALFESDPAVRMMFRSTHIYILMAGLLNIALGSYLVLSRQRWRRNLQLTGSTFILLGPVLLICAFFYEPSARRVERPLTLPAMILLLSGTTSHLLSTTRRRGVNHLEAGISDQGLGKAVGASDYGRGD